MTQEVAKRDERRAVAIPTDGADGLSGEFGQGDMAMPICSLGQPMSQGKTEGKFSFPDGRSLDDLEVVVLDIVATRAIWAPVDSGIGAPLCRSADRRMGITLYSTFIEHGKREDIEKLTPEGAEDEQYIVCADCRFGPSAMNFEKVDGLWCPNGYTLLMLDVRTDEPFLYFVKGMQMKSVKQRIVSPALVRLRRTGSAMPWAVTYGWQPRIVEEKEKKRKYYVADITIGPDTSDDDRKQYAEMSVALRGRASEQTEEMPRDEAEQPQPAAAPSDGAKQRQLPRD